MPQAVAQRTAAATETIHRLARHAFDRLEWKCDAANARSRRAPERFGFTFEGIFRDTAWYSILDRDWPAVSAGFEAWLAPENFDAHGRQRRALGQLRDQRRRTT